MSARHDDHGHAHDHGHAAHAHDDDHAHPHPPSHDPHGRHADAHHHHDLRELGRRALLLALALNAAFLVVEAAVGWWSGSLALLSDATHMGTDVVALAIAWGAATLRLRPREGQATFGHARVAVVGGLLNALLAIGASIGIVVEAGLRMRAPPAIPGVPVLVVAAIGLVVNVVSAWRLHASGDRGVNLRGALLHMAGDALGSVAALLAGVVLWRGGPAIVDPVASIVVAVIVLASGLPLLRDAVLILLERAPRGLDLDAMRALLRGHGAVQDVASVHAWELDDGEVLGSFVLVTDQHDVATLADVGDALRALLRDRFGVTHATIEWRPASNPRACC